ncbi:hypothetical protein ACFL13_03230, partial [Patescibacteria group bacterium]
MKGIILASFISLITIGTAYVFVSKNFPDIPDIPEVKKLVLSKVKKEDPTASWKVFNHENPKYTVKYPKDWKLDVTKNPTMGELEFVTFYIGEDTFASTCSFGITTWDGSFENDLEYLEDRADIKTTETIGAHKARGFVNQP